MLLVILLLVLSIIAGLFGGWFFGLVFFLAGLMLAVGIRGFSNKRIIPTIVGVAGGGLLLLLLVILGFLHLGDLVGQASELVTSGSPEVAPILEKQPVVSQNPSHIEVEMSGATTIAIDDIKAQTSCRTQLWWEEAQSATSDVASLISLLDRDFVLSEGGQWSEPGFEVSNGSVFWTDLFDNINNLPKGVTAVRVQGGWGVFYTTVDYVIPSENGGGRFLQLC